ncbi:MAG: helix-turn-helix transcriptional regulator [Bacteroidia bacterium]|nr:helix-turn-helix transcriptional regulator [Bacteroidia bacterium]
MKRLGEFEETALLLVGILGQEAYAFNLVKELKEEMGRSISVGAMHSTLNRLEKKGFLNSEVGGATAKRGGRRKRVYTITALGQEALILSRDFKLSLWKRYPPLTIDNLQWGN